MKTIKVLGTGCSKCKTTILNAEEALRQLGLDIKVEKVENIDDILKYDILSTPAIVIDEVVKIKGRVATIDEIKFLLS